MEDGDNKVQGALFSYLLPVIVGLLLAAIGFLHGLLKIESIVFSFFLILTIGLAIYLSELVLTRNSRTAERQQIFSFLSTILFRQQSVGSRQHLSLDEVMALERTASMVWVYAYDLKWEDASSALPDLVRENLNRGAIYHYIVPPSATVSVRVQALLAKYSNIKSRDSLIQFRVRAHEQKLIQFGIVIYNPSITCHDQKKSVECVAVFFPHYESLGPTTTDVKQFLALRGPSTVEIQEGFLEVWQSSSKFRSGESKKHRTDSAGNI